MKKKYILVTGFFFIVPLVIFGLIFYTLYLYRQDSNTYAKNFTLFQKNVDFKALPGKRQQIVTALIQEDVRVDILNTFFSDYRSPLSSYGQEIVKAADTYNIDYRLVPAIAMQESNLCKRIPKQSYNCWGFGIYGKKMTRFTDYATAIDTVSRVLSQQYIKKGFRNPEQIREKYDPSNTGSWAEGVSYFMNKLAINL